MNKLLLFLTCLLGFTGIQAMEPKKSEHNPRVDIDSRLYILMQKFLAGTSYTTIQDELFTYQLFFKENLREIMMRQERHSYARKITQFYFNVAQKWLEKEWYEEAIQLINEALQEYPKDDLTEAFIYLRDYTELLKDVCSQTKNDGSTEENILNLPIFDIPKNC